MCVEGPRFRTLQATIERPWLSILGLRLLAVDAQSSTFLELAFAPKEMSASVFSYFSSFRNLCILFSDIGSALEITFMFHNIAVHLKSTLVINPVPDCFSVR